MYQLQKLVWRLKRSRSTFRIYIVQPSSARVDFEKIFISTIGFLLEAPEYISADTLEHEKPEPFDLVTFPEAFLPVETVLSFLGGQVATKFDGCIHAGLRPSRDDNNHLFTKAQLLDLIGNLRGLPDIVEDDLIGFARYVDELRPACRINVGILFAFDIDNKLRLCLHVKVIRSKYESSFESEEHMTEGRLLTSVTLLPQSPSGYPIHIQPLICADLLGRPEDEVLSSPLQALANAEFRDAETLWPPEAIDIVSVVTATPTAGLRFSAWKGEFQEALKNSTDGTFHSRLQNACFVLTNYGAFGSGQAAKKAGLSGIFFSSPRCMGLSLLRDQEAEIYCRVDTNARGQVEMGNQENGWFSWRNELQNRGYSPSWATLGTFIHLPYSLDPQVPAILGITLQAPARYLRKWGDQSRNALTKSIVYISSLAHVDEQDSKYVYNTSYAEHLERVTG